MKGEISVGPNEVGMNAELRHWLELRERSQRLYEDIRAHGGHLMLKRSTVNPLELDKPLRSEAIAYLRRAGMWDDNYADLPDAD